MRFGLVRFALAACVALLSSSCLDVIRFKDQEVQLRFDAEHDALDVLLIYQGVSAAKDDEKTLDVATRAVRDMALNHRRYFIIADWFLELDLDGKGDDVYSFNPIEELERTQPGEPDNGALPRAKHDLARWLRGVSMKESGFFRGPKGHLGLYQWLHVPGAAEGVRLLNEGLRLWTLDEAEDVVADLDLKPFVDEARAGKDWAKLESGALVLDLPMSGERFAHMLARMAKSTRGVDDFVLPGLLAALTDMRVDANRALLRAAPDEAGRIRFVFADIGDKDYDVRLSKRLRDMGEALDDVPSLEAIQARLAK